MYLILYLQRLARAIQIIVYLEQDFQDFQDWRCWRCLNCCLNCLQRQCCNWYCIFFCCWSQELLFLLLLLPCLVKYFFSYVLTNSETKHPSSHLIYQPFDSSYEHVLLYLVITFEVVQVFQCLERNPSHFLHRRMNQFLVLQQCFDCLFPSGCVLL